MKVFISLGILLCLSPISFAAVQMDEGQTNEKLWADAYTICQKVVPQSASSCVEGMFYTIQMGPVVYGGRVIYKNGRFTRYFSEARPLPGYGN